MPHLGVQQLQGLLQGIVNHEGHFTHIFTGWAGSTHNVCIICKSLLPQMMESGHYTPGVPSCIIGAIVILPLTIRDPAYLLQPWLMNPYVVQLDHQKEHFNYVLIKCCMSVECTFGHLREH